MLKTVIVRLLPLALLIGALTAPGAHAQDRSIILQSTTSTANSGLYDHILPLFRSKTGITVNVVAVGTGQAIKNAQNGDGDVLLVHAKTAEEKFVADGYGVERYDVMYNDFIIVGPPADPAGIAGMKDATAALEKIAEASGRWYRETGSGMGATLNTAVGMSAYTMTDRGTWISFKNKGDYEILVEGDANLFNQYGVILVNPDKHKRVKLAEGQAFIDWILGEEGQAAIAGYRLDGQQLFFPNAR